MLLCGAAMVLLGYVVPAILNVFKVLLFYLFNHVRLDEHVAFV